MSLLEVTHFTARPTLPENYERDTWTTLCLAVNAVQTQKAITASREELYKVSVTPVYLMLTLQSVENLVDHNLSENLYKNLVVECENHIKEQYQHLMEESYPF